MCCYWLRCHHVYLRPSLVLLAYEYYDKGSRSALWHCLDSNFPKWTVLFRGECYNTSAFLKTYGLHLIPCINCFQFLSFAINVSHSSFLLLPHSLPILRMHKTWMRESSPCKGTMMGPHPTCQLKEKLQLFCWPELHQLLQPSHLWNFVGLTSKRHED